MIFSTYYGNFGTCAALVGSQVAMVVEWGFYYNYILARGKKNPSKNLLICHRTIAVGPKTFEHAVEKIKGITRRDILIRHWQPHRGRFFFPYYYTFNSSNRVKPLNGFDFILIRSFIHYRTGEKNSMMCDKSPATNTYHTARWNWMKSLTAVVIIMI